MAEIYGLTIGDLSEGWQPVNAIVIARCVDMETGKACVRAATTDDLSAWEAIGMLDIYAAMLRSDCLAMFEGDDDA